MYERRREQEGRRAHDCLDRISLHFVAKVLYQNAATWFFDAAASRFVHVLNMTTFYSGHEYAGRRAENCERSVLEKRNASQRANVRQNALPASILKQSHLQKMVTPEGYIHPASYSSCTLPSNIAKTRTKFLNLRDSVKKSPTKSTAKSGGSGERFSGRVDTLWASVSFEKVC